MPIKEDMDRYEMAVSVIEKVRGVAYTRERSIRRRNTRMAHKDRASMLLLHDALWSL